MPVSKAMEPKTANGNKNGRAANGNTAAPAKSQKKTARQMSKSVVPYPKPEAKVYYGEDAMTYTQAKELIGWVEESDGQKFKEDYLFKLGDRKIRTIKNKKNRDFQLSNAQLVMQEVLRGNWQLNGETLIIGRNGNVLSAQHRLIGFIMAVEEWRANKAAYPFWKTEPVLEVFVSYGISEEDKVVNTIDTGRPRTLDDVIFRSSYFAKTKPAERKILARATKFAIQFLWDRTGAKGNLDYSNLKRTHLESTKFLERHPRLLDCIKHLVDEENCHQLVQSPGTAAGLMYLMATSRSEMDKYQQASPPNEKVLDFKNWEKAENFFVELGSAKGKLKNVKTAYVEAKGEHRNRLDHNEIVALLIKAWGYWLKGESPTPKDLALQYVIDAESDDMEKVLDDFPTAGGIDLGKESYDPIIEPDEVEDDEAEEENTDPTPEEIAKEARKMKMEKLRKEQEAKKTPKPTGPLGQGDTVWICEADGGAWRGTLTAPIKGGKALVKVGTGFAGANKVLEVDAAKLQREQPIH